MRRPNASRSTSRLPRSDEIGFCAKTLPIRVENYDWPKNLGGSGDLLEMYCYVNLRLNPGLAADAFDR